MNSTGRRAFLKICLQSVPALVAADSLAAHAFPAPDKQARAYLTPALIERFIDPLPLPARLKPYDTSKGVDRYRIRMLEFSRQLHSQLPPTRLWGYEGQYPGPTIEAFRGRPVHVDWENRLPAQHILPIDPHIHGAMPPTPAVRVVPHLHGSRTPPESDGLPE
jgi:spore coat protein A